jgi:prolyl-tRNA synthetase
MRLTRYFLPVLKENPAEAQIVSHRFMLRAGLIKQQAAGIYSWLPLGFKVLRRLEQIVHEEQQRAGHIPLLMPTLQPADLWRESGRYEAYGDEMLRIRDRQGRDMLYGPTNEEMITDIFRSGVTSYKDLPLTLYHIQWKFRDEMRPRFGVMRGREFLMKDGYNFDIDRDSALHAYNRHMVSYLRTYERMGLTAIPMRAASGPIGGDDTHEFLVLASTGESEVFFDRAVTELKLGRREVDYDNRQQVASICQEFTRLYARTDETHDAALFDQIPEERRVVGRGIEVGQIFFFGTKYSESMNAYVTSAEGSPGPRPDGLARDRRLPPPGRDHRGQPRRQGHHLARGRDAFPRRHRQPQAGRHRGRRRLRRHLPPRSRRAGLEPLYDDRDAPGGREVRDDGPDRHAVADHRRSPRAQDRCGGAHLPPHGRERGDEPRGRRGPRGADLRRDLRPHHDDDVAALVAAPASRWAATISSKGRAAPITGR